VHAISRGVPAANRGLLRRLWLSIVAVVCGIVAFGIYNEAAHGSQLDSQVAQLQQQNAQLQQEIEDRQREIVEAQTVAWLEEEARKLGYVMPGERVFVVTPPGQSLPPSGGVNAPLPSFQPIATPTPTPTPQSSAARPPSPTPSAPPTPAHFAVPSPSPSGR